ncbi:DUF6351 family protein [Variovorax sp. EBFNA2]|uniref:DUF6351 family protein n=1 Tax=Variovorax sp. EBFNA2 TaxID=3342097 RepID=UPI0029C0C84E|nr:DUF6351 family protein [Variovorax boronicumulans]WPG41518.1 DUF6351 family protein [Variovorax boronicumulans]
MLATPHRPHKRVFPWPGIRRRAVAVGVAMAGAMLVAGCGGGSGGGGFSFIPVASPPPAAQTPAETPAVFQVKTLSSAPDMISGGDTLIEITAPGGVAPDKVRVSLNGSDVTAQVPVVDSTARVLRGLVTGLTTEPGSTTGSVNTLVVSNVDVAAQRTEARLVNYPITGPILSGSHISPYECRTIQSGLGNPRDANCSATTLVTYYYRGSASCPAGAVACFKPLTYPTAARPADLLNTTTKDGVTVPYIVRVERGTINRGIYDIAMLDNPPVGAALPAKFVPGTGWNRKLLVYFSGGGGAAFNQGTAATGAASDALGIGEPAIARGFAFVTSTELWNNQHSNPYVQGETLMMLKEYFIERVGIPKWTSGLGASGGGIQQYLLAQLFPGLLDGLQTFNAFPETFMPNVYECRLANAVFASDPARWTTAKQVSVQGFTAGTCNSWDLAFASLLIGTDYAPGCAVSDPANVARIYNRQTNPAGDLFCGFLETNTNLFGKDASGRARRPFDNVGVQYGLKALNRGAITTTEFLDFNQLVGGFDSDGHGLAVPSGPVAPAPAAPRHVADLDAVRLAYAGGFKNSFASPGLSNVPILEQYVNASGTADIHDAMQGLIIRARLQRANGRADNHVLITSSTESAIAGYNYLTTSLDIMNDWLDAIVADPAAASIAKVVRLKPASATDACIDKAGVRIDETQSLDPATTCNTIYPRASTLRIAAGEPLVQDGVKCALKPVKPSDYAVTFSNSELARLNQIFPEGVCDWTQPGVNQVPLKGTYLRLPLN